MARGRSVDGSGSVGGWLGVGSGRVGWVAVSADCVSAAGIFRGLSRANPLRACSDRRPPLQYYVLEMGQTPTAAGAAVEAPSSASLLTALR